MTSAENNTSGDSTAIITSVVPWLSVRESKKAVVFYATAFGAVERYRLEGPDGEVVAKLSIDGADFWVSEASPESSISPASTGGNIVRMILTTRNPESLFKRALEAGATEIFPVAEEHGWKLGRLADPFGHHWEIGHPLSNKWPPYKTFNIAYKTGSATFYNLFSSLKLKAMKKFILFYLLLISLSASSQNDSKFSVVHHFKTYGYVNGKRLDSLDAMFGEFRYRLFGGVTFDYGQNAQTKKQSTITDSTGTPLLFDESTMPFLLNFFYFNGWQPLEPVSDTALLFMKRR
jgi:PhnB protein